MSLAKLESRKIGHGAHFERINDKFRDFKTFEPGREDASVIGLGIGELEPQKAFFKDCLGRGPPP